MTTPISRSASPMQLLTQLNITPKIPVVSAFSARLPRAAAAVSSSTPISGASILSAAADGPIGGAYSSTSAVSQMNQDLLDAQAQNEAARQRQLQPGNDASPLPGNSENMELLKLQIAMQRESQYF